jgi:hypothetical protein
MIDPKDKTDIIMALREVATAIEQDKPGAQIALQSLANEMLVLAVKNAPMLAGITPEDAEALARREIGAVIVSIAMFQQNKMSETEIINARLVRQFDPAMAWNEAINRAIVAKKAAREEIAMMTSTQQKMFEAFQVPTTMKALRSA